MLFRSEWFRGWCRRCNEWRAQEGLPYEDPMTMEEIAAIVKEVRAEMYAEEQAKMNNLNRITLNPLVMGGKPCIRGMRITVGTLVGLVSAGHSFEEILEEYPILEREDIEQALQFLSRNSIPNSSSLILACRNNFLAVWRKARRIRCGRVSR